MLRIYRQSYSPSTGARFIRPGEWDTTMNINRSLARRHRWLRKAAIVVAVLAAVGLEATPAMALTHRSYNIMRNAQLNQLCLDIDAPTHLAQLWSCHHPVTANQQYIVTTPA